MLLTSNPRRISCASRYSRSVRHIGRECCKLFARHSTRRTHRFLALNSKSITRLQPPPEGKKRTAFRCTMSGALNLLILGTATTAKKAPLPDPLYVYCTKMLFALECNIHHMATTVSHRSSGMDRKST